MSEVQLLKAPVKTRQEALIGLANTFSSVVDMSDRAMASLCKWLKEDIEEMTVGELVEQIEAWQWWFANRAKKTRTEGGK